MRKPTHSDVDALVATSMLILTGGLALVVLLALIVETLAGNQALNSVIISALAGVAWLIAMMVGYFAGRWVYEPSDCDCDDDDAAPPQE